MSRWHLAAALALGGFTLASAQVQFGVNDGLNSNGGAMSGDTINRVPGTNRNGTPRQQLPGASMTNGAGYATMTPGVTGGSARPGNGLAPPKIITLPTINGKASPPGHQPGQ